MRVIAGKFRSRPLRSLRGMDIRPTSGRLRETLFNVLTSGNPQALTGSIWLDLFAGTGAIGIEAISRGAGMVYFVESSKPAVKLLYSNLHSLGIETGYRLLQQPALRGIASVASMGVSPDVIFLDPPYRLQEAYGATLGALAESQSSAHALIIAEHEKKFDPGEEFGSLRRTRLLQQGDSALSLYRR